MQPGFPRGDSRRFFRAWEGASPTAWPARKSPAWARRSNCGQRRPPATWNARRNRPPIPQPPAQAWLRLPHPGFQWRLRPDRSPSRSRVHARGRSRHARGSASPEFYSQNGSGEHQRRGRVARDATGRAYLAARARNSIDSLADAPYHEIDVGFREIPGCRRAHGP